MGSPCFQTLTWASAVCSIIFTIIKIHLAVLQSYLPPPTHTHTYVLFVIDTFSHWSSNMPSRLKSVMNISWMKLPHIILRKGLSNIKLPMWIYNGKIAQSLNRHKTFAQSLMSVLQTDTLAYQKKDYFYTYNILIRHIRLAHISFIDH